MAGVGCCRSGPIKGHLSLPRCGFVAGQPIPFHVVLENGSRKKLVSVRVILSQVSACTYSHVNSQNMAF